MSIVAKKSKKVCSPVGDENWEQMYVRLFSPERRIKIDAAAARALARQDAKTAKNARVVLTPPRALYADIKKHAAARGISTSEYFLTAAAFFLQENDRN